MSIILLFSYHIEHIRPACLPLKSAINHDITGIDMVAAGWGKINDSKL